MELHVAEIIIILLGVGKQHVRFIRPRFFLITIIQIICSILFEVYNGLFINAVYTAVMINQKNRRFLKLITFGK